MRQTTVLVADDQMPVRLLCQVNLELAGMRILEATDGRTALALARSERPDVILLDVMMPELDGWRVAEELLDDEQTAEIPIIFLSARADPRDQARGIELGGVDYLTKPFDPVALAPMIEALLERIRRGERDEIRTERLRELQPMLQRNGRGD